MASNLEAYLKLCPPGSDPTLLNGEVQSLKQNHEEMCIEVSVYLRVCVAYVTR